MYWSSWGWQFAPMYHIVLERRLLHWLAKEYVHWILGPTFLKKNYSVVDSVIKGKGLYFWITFLWFLFLLCFCRIYKWKNGKIRINDLVQVLMCWLTRVDCYLQLQVLGSVVGERSAVSKSVSCLNDAIFSASGASNWIIKIQSNTSHWCFHRKFTSGFFKRTSDPCVLYGQVAHLGFLHLVIWVSSILLVKETLVNMNFWWFGISLKLFSCLSRLLR